jgi:hypothetical protein
VLRLTLTIIGWPHTNSEEGTMGLEAMHILLRGEHPIYFYGQNYMGVGEAYAGALAFRLFGISVATLRLGMIGFYAIFMVGVWWLADHLYSRRVALASLAVLVLGTPFLGQMELRADGGKVETMAFGAMMFGLASWLALSQPTPQAPRRHRMLRYAAFAAWGLIAGLGLYTYVVVVPLVLTSGLLLVITCWRELRSWLLVLPLAGLLIGLLPAIIYAVMMPFKDNPISVFLTLHQSLNGGAPLSRHLLAKQVEGTLLYTLPTVTGLINLYPLQALPLYGPLGPATFASVIIGGGWSLGYFLLLGAAMYRPLRALWHDWTLRRARKHPSIYAQTDMTAQAAAVSMMAQYKARNVARLLLPFTALLIIAAYMLSETAANNPYSGRYMIGLLVIVPAILWPIVDRPLPVSSTLAEPVTGAGWAIVRNASRPAAVALLGASLVLGAIGVVHSIPDAQAVNTADAKHAQDLLSHGITRFYSDYWTCDKLNFETQERLICGVIRNYGQRGRMRYLPYFAMVQADKNAPYVVVRGSIIESTFLIHATESHQQYSMEHLDIYDVYTPKST